MAASENMKIFGIWDCNDIEITDIGLKRYINLEERLLPHSSGRHEHKRFHKSYVHIVERFANKLMSPGKNTGKKNLTMNIVKDALQIVEFLMEELFIILRWIALPKDVLMYLYVC